MARTEDRRGEQHIDDRGAALVELAIVLPVLIMIIFAVYSFALGYHAKIELTGAVREGARNAALGADVDDIRQAVLNASPGLAPERVIVTTGTECDGSGNAEVRASYTLPYSIPFFDEGLWNIEALGVMRCEN